MPKIKFHKIAAVAVLVATAAWIATGEFSSVGSASQEAEAATSAEEASAPQSVVELQTVAVVEPPRVSHARTIRISGQTAADKRAALATRSSGVIAELPVSKGDRVEEGDLILRLDSEGKAAGVEAARQTLAQRQAEADAAERLAKSGNMAKLQLDNARSALAAAQSQLELAEAELDRTMVRAPFGGLVDAVPVELGSSVMQGAEVATLIKLDPILAVGEVSEHDLGAVDRGDPADVRLVNGTTVEGKVRFVSRAASEATRTYRVEVAVPNADGSIPAGMTAEISVRAESVEAVALPRSVVTLSNEGELGIRAINASNKVVFYPIDIVDDTPRALYLAGIPADARVIVAGQDLVTDGETVNPEEADAELVRSLAGSLAGEGTE